MHIDHTTIRYIASLAMIELLPEEEEKYSKALEQILSYTDILNDLDLEKMDAMSMMISSENRFREDIVISPISRELLLSNSKSVESGMFCIPKVVE